MPKLDSSIQIPRGSLGLLGPAFGFREGTGPTISDDAGLVPAGSLNGGAAWVSALNGPVIRMTSPGDFVKFPTDPAWAPDTTELTVLLAVKPTAFKGDTSIQSAYVHQLYLGASATFAIWNNGSNGAEGRICGTIRDICTPFSDGTLILTPNVPVILVLRGKQNAPVVLQAFNRSTGAQIGSTQQSTTNLPNGRITIDTGNPVFLGRFDHDGGTKDAPGDYEFLYLSPTYFSDAQVASFVANPYANYGATHVPAITVTPTTATAGTSAIVTATRSSMSLTSGTTYIVAGGDDESLFGISVNSDSLNATSTLDPGMAAETLSSDNSTDSATAMLATQAAIIQKPAANAIFSPTIPLPLGPAYGLREGTGTSTLDDAGLAPAAAFQGGTAWASTAGGPVVRLTSPGDYLSIPYAANNPFDAATDALTAIVSFTPSAFGGDGRAAFHKRIGYAATTLGLVNSTVDGAFQGVIGGVSTVDGPALSTGTAYIGVVRGQANKPVSLRIYDRATGQLVGEVVSSTNIGAGPITVPGSGTDVWIGRLNTSGGSYIKDLPGDYEFFFYSPTYLSDAQLDAFAANPYANYTSASAPRFVAGPVTASTGVLSAITVTGTNTSWTNGTTFSITGGTNASISNLSVNARTQTATFTLNPGTTAGPLTISNSTDSAIATIAVAAAFDWLAAFESAMSWAATGQSNSYPQSANYAADADDHYDPISIFEGIRAYTGSSSWDAQIAAAVDHYREQAVFASGGGVQGHHAYDDGLLAHYERTGDTKSRDAAILVSYQAAGSNDSSPIYQSYPQATSREVAFSIETKLATEALGCAHRTRLDEQVAAALGHIAQWTAPPGTRYWATYCRPFMAGLTMEALIKYWLKYRAAPDTGTGSPGNLAAQIPAAIKSMCDWLWANTWHGGSYDGYDYGGFQYTDADLAVKFAPINSTVTSVTSPTSFRGDTSLLNQDAYFRFAAITFTSGPLSGQIFGCTGYTGSTREFRLEYPAGPLSGNPGVGSTFQISFGSDPSSSGDLSNAASLNPLIAPAYAFAGWHDKVVLGLSSTSYLDRFEAIMRGAYTLRVGMLTQKLYNQTYKWSIPGVRWFQRAAAEYPTATALTLTGPGTAGRVNAMSDRFVVALSGSSGSKSSTAAPVKVTPSDGGAGGAFFPAFAILTTERPRATFRYRPASMGAKPIAVTNDGGLSNPAAVTYIPSGKATVATALGATLASSSGPANTSTSLTYGFVPTDGVPPTAADPLGGLVLISIGTAGFAQFGYDSQGVMGGNKYAWVSPDNPTIGMRLYVPGGATGAGAVGGSNDIGLTNPPQVTYTIGAATPTFTVSPTTATAGTPLTITATGSNTSWTNGTTFSVTGGTGASISNLSINIAAQTATFALNPGTTAGPLALADSTDSATSTVTVRAAFDWFGAFESTMNWAATGQPQSYPQLPSYAADADDLYDVINVFEQIRAYTGSSSWDAQIAAAVDHYREQGVFACGGATAGHHAYADGLLLNYERTGDTKSRDAAILVSELAAGSIDGSPIDWSSPQSTSREVAFSILTKLVGESLGCAHRPRLEQQVAAAMGHIAQWTAPAASRYLATYCRPFMAGLTMEALIKYWLKYRAAPDTGTGSPGNLAAQIPAAIKSMCDWLWANTWHGGPYRDDQDGTWAYGGFQYTDIDLRFWGTPPTSTVASVPDTTKFRGDSSLSNQDDYYRFASVQFSKGPLSGQSFICTGYVGSTREFHFAWPGNPLTGSPTVGDAFSIQFGGGNPSTGSTPSGLSADTASAASLNPLIAPAYAWYGWYNKVVLGNSDTTYLDRFEAIMRGTYTLRVPPPTQRLYNQTYKWSIPGVRWFQRASSEYPTATALTLTGPGTAGRVNAMSDRFVVSLSGPQSPVSVQVPVEVTPSDSGAGGTFFPAVIYLSTERPQATFRYRPSSPGAKSISFNSNPALKTSAAVSYTPSGTASIASAITATLAKTSGPKGVPVELDLALSPPAAGAPATADPRGGLILISLDIVPSGSISYLGQGVMNPPLGGWISSDNPTLGMTFTPTDQSPIAINYHSSTSLSNPPGSTFKVVVPGTTVPPKLLSATVDESGTLLTLAFSISVTGGTGFTISRGHSLGSPSVLDRSLTYTITPVVLRDEDLTLAYKRGDVADATDVNNRLEEFSAVVVNHSIKPEPAIPRIPLIVPRPRNRPRPFGRF